ncbi:MAG: hypothetical protein ACLF0G_07750 [Candidatus Brocadiia bacterium]
MSKSKPNLLGLFVLLSLALHAGAYLLAGRFVPSNGPSLDDLAVVPLVHPQPPEAPGEKSLEAPTPDRPPPGTQRFRPNLEPQEGPAAEPEADQAPSPEPPHEPAPEPQPLAHPDPPEPQPTEALAEAPEPDADRAPEPAEAPPPASPVSPDEVEAFREQLLDAFDPRWRKVPDLVVAAQPDVQRQVSRHFEMKLIAYPKGVKNPTYVILIDEQAKTYRYTHEFDFERYSNRVKDRTHVPSYARLVKRAKSRLALPEDLTIASLVPLEADAYFAAKQMAAVRAAGVPLDEVARTEGRYGRDAQDRIRLIIQRVVTVQGRTIEVEDPERNHVELL